MDRRGGMGSGGLVAAVSMIGQTNDIILHHRKIDASGDRYDLMSESHGLQYELHKSHGLLVVRHVLRLSSASVMSSTLGKRSPITRPPRRTCLRTWFAQALNADVPEGWITGEGEGEYEGLVYYYNEATGESTWEHPLDDYYR